MKTSKKIVVGLFIILVGIQFIRPDSNNDNRVMATDFIKTYEVPTQIGSVLRRSCYDCHSNNTEYPWYSSIQPMGWLINKHISEGKKNLNFSEFGTYSQRKQVSKLKSIAKQIEQNKMPLPSYTMIHQNAILTSNEKSLIVTFVNNLTQ
ncbi:heme-binding domain-containing protein [Runella sp. MFBS21]|uniref:heme-binding domain-containing protein n=1 Tax=Runella sp. MFBS21 TaxID=3034018 RepID=UPI0023F6D624|nr:heme-binding domain-containing protein [Runella sp. MFBS21]MCA0233106.1 heme-binding domain-containing protein [Bacteroidota bacterium]MDF7821230.1 heme-binding domain-containing protein [Runella sp. MFBS21]